MLAAKTAISTFIFSALRHTLFFQFRVLFLLEESEDKSVQPERRTLRTKAGPLAASSEANVNGTHFSNGDLRGAVGTLGTEQRRLIDQLFWEERTETEVADATGINQSTINRRKQAILNGLRMKLRDRNEFRTFSA